MDHAEHGEHKNERTDELGEEGLSRADSGGVGGDAEAGVTRGQTQHADDRRGTGDGADHLGGEVGRHPGPGELARDGEAHRDGGVDVVAADVAQRVDGRDHHGGEREGDHAEVGHRERGVAVDDDRCGHRSHSDEHQEGGAERFGGQFLGEGWLVHACSPLSLN